MKKIFLLFFMFISTIGNAQVPDKLIGKWESSLETGAVINLELNEDGTALFGSEKVKYEYKNNILIIIKSNEKTEYAYKLSGNYLLLSVDEENAILFSRVKTAADYKKMQQLKTNPALIGKWKGKSGTMEFDKQGEGAANDYPFSYEEDGKKITISDFNGTYSFTYSITGNTLSMTGMGKVMIYSREPK